LIAFQYEYPVGRTGPSLAFVTRIPVVPYGSGNVNGPLSGKVIIGRGRIAVDEHASIKPPPALDIVQPRELAEQFLGRRVISSRGVM
jgi:hypothetical protein